MIGADVLEFTDLQRLSGYNRLSDVERWATDNGIQFKRCRGGIATTVTAFNAAMGIRLAGNDDPYDVGALFGPVTATR